MTLEDLHLDDDRPLNDSSEDVENREKYKGVPFEELVERLVAIPASKEDTDFATIFFCFYRKVAAPKRLLSAILSEFDKLDDGNIVSIVRTSHQLRICTVILHWISTYPGDLANSHTRHILKDFVDRVGKERIFNGIAKDMLLTLAAIGDNDDEDASWGKVDAEEHRNSLTSFITTSTGSNETTTSDDSFCDISNPSSSGDLHACPNGSHQTNPHGPLSGQVNDHTSSFVFKEQYILFMDISEEDIAKELTRIDWHLFSMIKPRDFIRHVSVPATEKENNKSLQHINRMIRHFNHVAYWVANLVLERPKPKHRARALEKFMNIAYVGPNLSKFLVESSLTRLVTATTK